MPAKRDYTGGTQVVRPASPHPRGGGTGSDDDKFMSDDTEVANQGRDMDDQPAGRNVNANYKRGGTVKKYAKGGPVSHDTKPRVGRSK